MSELTVADVTIRTGLNPPGGVEPQDSRLQQPVSWAVALRATPPRLPKFSGDEIVIASDSVLRELSLSSEISRNALNELLVGQSIAALVISPAATFEPPTGIFTLRAPADCDLRTLESEMNRQITEMRADLYRLGAKLARALSSSAMAGASLDRFLNVAESIVEVPVVLVTAGGAILGRSSRAAPELSEAVLTAMRERHGNRFIVGEHIWLMEAVEGGPLPPGVMLALTVSMSASLAVARMAMSQIADSLRLLFDRLPPPEMDLADVREEVLRDFLLGELPISDQRLERYISDIEIGADSRLFLQIGGRPLQRQHIDKVKLEVKISSDEVVRLGNIALIETCRDADGASQLVASGPVSGLSSAPQIVARLRTYAELARKRLLPDRFTDLSNPSTLGVYGIIQALLTDSSGAELARDFARDYTQVLDAYDREHQTELVASLRTFLQMGGSLTDASSSLGIHRNTLAYRLKRIEEIIALDLSDADTRIEMRLAIIIRDLESLQMGT